MRSRQAGRALPLLVALIALAGVGAWNYHRNWQAEQALPRPFRSYSSADLEQLAQAYESEASGLESAAEGRRGTKVRDTDFGEAHREFERVQRISSRDRLLGGELAHREGRLAEIRAEQEKRRAEADRLRLHLGRLIRF